VLLKNTKKKNKTKMPTVTLNKDVFEELVGKKLPMDELKERISMLGTDLETIEGDEIHVEIFPNRPDMLSEQGFARAFSSFIGVKTGLREYKTKKSDYKLIIDKSVKDVRPYSACCVVKNLNLDDEKIKEIIQIQEKLHITYGRNRKKVAIGIYPMEKIEMPIRFMAKAPKDIVFQPLEADREMNGEEILKDHPTGKDYGHLLEGKKAYPIFVDAKDRILSMPPIINSELVGRVNLDTKEVFIECSGFDYEVLARCLNMIATALADMGGEIVEMEIEMYGKKVISPDLNPTKMDVDLSYVNRMLGLDLKEKDIKTLLSKMGFGYDKRTALVPSYRADILHQIDLVEDIAIAYGYENIPEVIPKVATIAQEISASVFQRKVTEMLIGLGLIECKTYHIANKLSQTKMMELKEPKDEKSLVELGNALNEDFNVLARWLIPSLFEVLKNNRQREYPQDIFSFGRIFEKAKKIDEDSTGITEKDNLACMLCSEEADFTKAKQVLDYIMRMIGKDYEIKEIVHPSFIKGRVGNIMIGKECIGLIGEISPKVLSNWDIKFPAAALEIETSSLF
jgi:phenylalanyl-tRNA synthetase beta chain